MEELTAIEVEILFELLREKVKEPMLSLTEKESLQLIAGKLISNNIYLIKKD